MSDLRKAASGIAGRFCSCGEREPYCNESEALVALIEFGAMCLDAAKISDEEYRGRLCTDPAHDDRHCPTCNVMQDGVEYMERRLESLKRQLTSDRQEGKL
jgi:hypothetical protein